MSGHARTRNVRACVGVGVLAGAAPDSRPSGFLRVVRVRMRASARGLYRARVCARAGACAYVVGPGGLRGREQTGGASPACKGAD